MTEKLLLTEVHEMDFQDFKKRFSAKANEKKPKSVAAVYGLLKVIKSVEDFSAMADDAPFSIDAAIGRHIRELELNLDEGIPIRLDREKRAECLFSPQFLESGKIRSLGIESWGIKAIITRNHEHGRPDFVLLKEWPPQQKKKENGQ
jgi:hypothetical protein